MGEVPQWLVELRSFMRDVESRGDHRLEDFLNGVLTTSYNDYTHTMPEWMSNEPIQVRFALFEGQRTLARMILAAHKE